MDVDRVLATVLFTDIVNSTGWRPRWATRPGGSSSIATTRYRAEVGRWHGTLVKSTGDGCLATFDAPTRALRCAFALRSALDARGSTSRRDPHGRGELRGDDLGGIGLHIASRALAEAGARQVVVTRTVRELATGTDLGSRRSGPSASAACPASGSCSRRRSGRLRRRGGDDVKVRVAAFPC